MAVRLYVETLIEKPVNEIDDDYEMMTAGGRNRSH